VVLGTFGAVEHNKDWVQTKLDQRIRSDLLTTVQACLVSIQNTKASYKRIKSRLRTHEQLHRQGLKAGQMLHGPGHRRKSSSAGSVTSLGSLASAGHGPPTPVVHHVMPRTTDAGQTSRSAPPQGASATQGPGALKGHVPNDSFDLDTIYEAKPPPKAAAQSKVSTLFSYPPPRPPGPGAKKP
jgi:hypothetical protein